MKISYYLVLFISLVLTVNQSISQVLPADKVAELQSIIENYYADEELLLGGLSAALYIEGEGSWKGATGISTITDAESYINTDTRFHIYSITKTYTAALILELMAEGRLWLDETVADYIDVSENVNVTGNATIKQLITHSSGIADYVANQLFQLAVYSDQAKIWQPKELLNYVGQPQFTQGTGIAYSSTNYILLGMIAEIVTDSTAEQLFRTFFRSA